MFRCDFNSTELKDMEYINSYYFNKMEIVRFSSSVGKYVGYTEFGLQNAEKWNNNPSFLATARAQRGTFCHNNIKWDYLNALTKSGESVFLFKQHQIIMLLIRSLTH